MIFDHKARGCHGFAAEKRRGVREGGGGLCALISREKVPTTERSKEQNEIEKSGKDSTRAALPKKLSYHGNPQFKHQFMPRKYYSCASDCSKFEKL